MPTTLEQSSFGGGLVATVAPHMVPDGAAQSASNVDFGLEPGAAVCRRGCGWVGSVSAGQPVTMLGRFYNNPGVDSGPWHAIGNGAIYRGTSTAGTVAFSSISGTGATGQSGYNSYQDYAYIASGTKGIKDNGTTVYDWVYPAPSDFVNRGTPGSDNHYVISSNTAFTVFNGSYTAVLGTNAGTSGTNPVLNTCTTGTGTIILLTATLGTATNLSNPDPAVTPFESTRIYAGTSTTTYKIGNFGVDYIYLGFGAPSNITRISFDLSYGDTTFANYWHVEKTVDDVLAFTPDSGVLADTLLATQDLIDSQHARSLANATSRRNNPKTGASIAGLNYLTWLAALAIPRTDYQFIGGESTPSFENIGAVRVSIESSAPQTVVIGKWETRGSEKYCLSDLQNGFRYWITWARIENGIVVAESAPGNPTPLLKFTNATFNLTAGQTPPTGTTHFGVYRSGGLIPTPVLVGYMTTAGALVDYGSPDLSIINDDPLNQDIWGSWPGDVTCVSDPWNARLFLGAGSKLRWTNPGQPSQIGLNNSATISSTGDLIQGLVVWDRLVIVNRDTIWEMDGNLFEGPNADYQIKKSGSRRGSKAANTIIKTPVGIPLLDYDGLSFYTPGYGIDTPVTWVDEKIGDAWKGASTSDPAYLKGQRVPAINKSYLNQSCAAWGDGKLYLAIPTGSNTVANTVFVLDFTTKNVQYYTYPFNVSRMFWDFVDNRMIAATTDGYIMRLEDGIQDFDTAKATQPITWSVKTKAWTAPTETIVENVTIEGIGTLTASMVFDGTSSSLGTMTTTSKAWQAFPANGSFANNVAFQFGGTVSTVRQGVYGLKWDGVPTPPKVQYWRSDFSDAGIEGEKQWDVHWNEIEVYGTGGYVKAVTFVDDVAVMTQTILPDTDSDTGNEITYQAFPVDVYGRLAYTTFTSTLTSTASGLSPITFKLWKDWYSARPEPPRVVNYVTSRETSEAENWYKGFYLDMDCLGTSVLGTLFIDEVAISTTTHTGSKRASYTENTPDETYGKVAYLKLVSAGGVFKLYKSWYDIEPEPARDLFSATPVVALDSENYLKTWVSELNPEGGTLVGSVVVDGTTVMTSTFTGTLRKAYEIGLPNITTGKTVKATYTSSTPFKHYHTHFEQEPKPYNKLTWLVQYRKTGGASQIDMVRFANYDIEAPIGTIITSTMTGDETVLATNTHIMTSTRQWFDQVAMPPGSRAYLFQQTLSASVPFKVWKANLDIDQEGVKGLTRTTARGTPANG